MKCCLVLPQLCEAGARFRYRSFAAFSRKRFVTRGCDRSSVSEFRRPALAAKSLPVCDLAFFRRELASFRASPISSDHDELTALRGQQLGLREPSRSAVGRPARLPMRRRWDALPALQFIGPGRTAADAKRF